MVEKILIIILGIIFLFAGTGLVLLSHPAFGLWRHRSTERIQASPNYYDGMFQNQEPTPQFTGREEKANGEKIKVKGDGVFKTLWRFLTDKDTIRIPSTPVAAVKTDLRALSTDEDWLVWFGHSSYLFCLNGKRVLVDPVLQPEWPSSMMLKAFPGTDIYRPNDLPEIDVLIVTHEHWDHMDYATLRDIRTKVKQVVCPLGIADYLRYWGYSDEQIVELDWYDHSTLKQSPPLKGRSGGASITCLPSRHLAMEATINAFTRSANVSERSISLSWRTASITKTGAIFTPCRETSKKSYLIFKPNRSLPSTMTSIPLLCTRGMSRIAWHAV